MNIKRELYDMIGEEVFSLRLDPGLTVMAIPRSGYKSSFAVFMTHYGSNDSTFRPPGAAESIEVPDGIAHFLEHQLFAQETGNVDERFAELGAYSNAFTSWNRTGYLVETSEDFAECFKTLIDFVLNPYFTPEGTEKEKGIIEQEIEMYEDVPEWQVYHNLLQCLYQNHPVRRDIVGTVESTRRITKELLDYCYQTFYHPSNMVLVAIGSFDPEQIIGLAKEQLDNLKPNPQGEIERCYPGEPDTVKEPTACQEMSVSLPLFALGWKETELGKTGDDLLRQRLLTEVALQSLIGESTPLYDDLYTRGLIDRQLEFGYSAYSDYGFTVMQGESKDPEQLKQLILAGIEQLQQAGIDADTFERSRKVLHGQFLRSLNSLDVVANQLADDFLAGIDSLRSPEILQQLTIEEVNDRLRAHLQPHLMAFSQVVPQQDDD